VDGSVPSAISANNGAPRGLKYLWQAHNITFTEGAGTAIGIMANDQAGYSNKTYLADGALPGFNVLNSPFFIGLTIGMWK
jgi:hypothetical protein